MSEKTDADIKSAMEKMLGNRYDIVGDIDIGTRELILGESLLLVGLCSDSGIFKAKSNVFQDNSDELYISFDCMRDLLGRGKATRSNAHL